MAAPRPTLRRGRLGRGCIARNFAGILQFYLWKPLFRWFRENRYSGMRKTNAPAPPPLLVITRPCEVFLRPAPENLSGRKGKRRETSIKSGIEPKIVQRSQSFPGEGGTVR